MNELWRRLRIFFGRSHFDRELEEEMRSHLEMQAEENRENGMGAVDAQHAARRQFGNTTFLKEMSLEMWVWGPVERLGQDLKYALRMLRKNPGFSAVAILVLALGIGANTAIFSAVNALLLNPFPFPEPERIVQVEAYHVSGQNRGAGYRDFLDWRGQNAVFEEMAIPGWTTSYTLTGQGEPQRITSARATWGFLRVLALQPALGRFFTADEDSPNGPRVAILSHATWQQRFGGRSEVLSQVMRLDGMPYTIIGVMPSRFVFPGIQTCDFWEPLQDNPLNNRYQHQYHAIARLKQGITVERAGADMTAIAHRLEQQYPETNRGWGIAVMPIAQALAGEVRTPVAVLFGTVLLVLLLACANVAGLTLARASGRAKEISIRASLGASRARIVRQMLTESLLLGLVSGTLGLLFARWLINVMRAAAPEDFGLSASLRMDTLVLGFTLALSMLTGIVFGLAPAWYGSKADLHASLKGGENAWSGARSRTRFLSALVAGEVALSLVLLVGAALLAKSLLLLLRADTGIHIEHVLTCELSPPRSKYASAQRAVVFYQELLEKLRAMPGVEAAGAVGSLPMSGGYGGGGFTIEGRTKPADWVEMKAKFENSTPGYFRAMGIPLLRGRDFDEHDAAAATLAAIINETLARRFFPNEDPIGRRIGDDWAGGGAYNERRWRTIVGVVGAIKHGGPTSRSEPEIYSPLAQSPSRGMWIALRTSGDPAMLADAVRGLLRSLDPDLPVEHLRTMRQVVSDSLSEARSVTSLMAGFSGFALVLAAVGVYGVVAYSVAQRKHEIGVRIALGASYADVLALILRKGALLTGAGVMVGVPAALAASRWIGSLLYGVSPRDLTIFAGIPLLLVIVALAATYIPARRAARVGPAEALRHE